MPDPRTRRVPGAASPTLNSDPGKKTVSPSVTAAGDVVAGEWVANGLGRYRRQIEHHLEQITTICGWCGTNPVDPALGDSCLGCRELGAGDVWSPRGGEA